jgi:type IV pilus assembly protein PilC
MVIVVSGVILGLRTREGRRVRDMVFLHVPIIGGIVREVNSARTARTLNSLLSAGVDMLSAISITGEVVQNSYFRDVLTDARKSVEKGKPLSRPFSLRDDLYPPLVGEMIAVGEETGQLAPMLGQLALFYEDEVARKTKDMSAIIEPFLMVLIGVAVGFFAVAMISPIYGLSDSL